MMTHVAPSRAMPSSAPLSDDPDGAVALLREALAARGAPAEEAIPWRSSLEREVEDGRARGLLLREGPGAIGIAVWDESSPVGATLEVAYIADRHRSPERYRALLEAIRERAGPVAFTPGGLTGLTASQEAALMRSLGFARFARSEMRLPAEASLPAEREGTTRFRSVRPDDLAALVDLHQSAYEGRFDRYLFQADPDSRRDAELAVKELLEGRWGEFLPWASPLAEGDRGPAGAVLVVRAPYGPLIADVVVDPPLQGRGIGRRLMVEVIRRLRGRGESVIVLNVTEGNARAIALYERLGFVRTLGPSYAWYATDRVPVPSGID
jgi:ribosomal protein S18 acetylase RimI-like enzyme